MQMIYNSPHYCVIEFQAPDGERGGYEIMDKAARLEIYLAGEAAQQFRRDVDEIAADSPTVEDFDQYLSRFRPLMSHPVVLH